MPILTEGSHLLRCVCVCVCVCVINSILPHTHTHVHLPTHTHTYTHTHTATLTIPGSAPAVRRRSGTPGGASIDDTFLANMIFDTPTKSTNQNSSLQKSPHHKSTSALNDVQPATTNPTQTITHPPVTGSKSVAYTPHNPPRHKQSTSSVQSNRSFTTDYSESPSYLTSLDGFADEFDSSPSSSIVSGSTNTFTSQKANQLQRRSDQGLRDFDLTEDFLQHFQMQDTPSNRRENHTPQTSVVKNTSEPSFTSPQKPGVNPHSRGLPFDLPATSSPVTRYKRAPSPTIPFTGDGKTRGHSSSPTPYLPEPDLTTYSSSYHPPSNLTHHHPHQSHPSQHVDRALYPNPPQHTNTSSAHHPRQGSGLKQGQDLMYDNEAALRYAANSTNYSGSDTQVPSGGSSSNIPVPVSAGQRQPGRHTSETGESYDLHEMLQIWAKSSKNPFGEGTLV